MCTSNASAHLFFSSIKDELTIQHNTRESIIRHCRDLTSFSKKLIFACHRSSFSEIRNDVLVLISDLSKVLHQLYEDSLEVENFMDYKKSISSALEEYVEYLSLAWYLKRGSLITFEEVLQVTKLLISASGDSDDELLLSVSHKLMSKNNERETIADLRDTSSVKLDFLFLGDYLMGMFDLTGELMRYSIVHVDDGSAYYVNSASAESLEIYNFMKELKLSLLDMFTDSQKVDVKNGVFVGNSSTQVAKKLETLKSSVLKVETAIISLIIRGKEVDVI